MSDSNQRPPLIGGLFLIIGTCIGGSMLALPMSTAAAGFGYGTLALFIGYCTMTLGAFMILEANLWFPEKSNLLTMTEATLGKQARNLTWGLYIILFVSLLAAYISAGSDLVRSVMDAMGIHYAQWVNQLVFTVTLGTIVRFGVKCVDWANRGLMLGKIGGFMVLVSLIAPSVKLHNLSGGQFGATAGALSIAINSFGYAPIIPSLRTYYASDSRRLHQAIVYGSIVPLLCYILWNFTVQGQIAGDGPSGLIAISHSNTPVHDLSVALFNLGIAGVGSATAFFVAICVATSFLGVALCLKDFLADGLNITAQGHRSTGLVCLALLPPFILDIINDRLFIIGLNMAGVICIILLIILPGMMVWSGRYRKQFAGDYTIRGGRKLIIAHTIMGLILLAITIPSVYTNATQSISTLTTHQDYSHS